MTAKKNHIRTSTWFKEWLTPYETHSHHIRRTLVKTRTPFQEAIIADFNSFGRSLILDGEIQSAQRDEFIYHEALVHPALMIHPHPKNVLVMGGGEGATAREILKYRSVEKIIMVDIDGDVVEFCKKHMGSWHQGSFDHPRLRLVIDDAKKFVETTREKFDVIISDLPSPMEDSPASLLYTVEFYRRLAKTLSKNGVFVMQAGSGNLIQLDLHKILFSTLKKVFRYVQPYYVYIPSFDGPWAYLMGTASIDARQFNAAQIDKQIRKRIRGKLLFYDGTTHVGLVHIPKYMRSQLNEEKRVYTKSKQHYFFKKS